MDYRNRAIPNARTTKMPNVAAGTLLLCRKGSEWSGITVLLFWFHTRFQQGMVNRSTTALEAIDELAPEGLKSIDRRSHPLGGKG
jgi:hypothetical protein